MRPAFLLLKNGATCVNADVLDFSAIFRRNAMNGAKFIRTGACLAWIALTILGFSLVLKYENTAGADANLGGKWPAGTALKLDATRDTIVLFAHPRCPCTRATVEELNRLLARTQGQATAQVWFFQPEGQPVNWAQSDLWQSAAAIPNVSVNADVGGREAARFGADTSGSVLLYAKDGNLLFKGGITAGRGHAGDNAGENAIASFLINGTSPLTQTAVYGCSIRGCESNINESERK